MKIPFAAIGYEALPRTDLVVDSVYEGGPFGNTRDDPIGRLIPVGNQGGFRFKKSKTKDRVTLCALYSALDNLDWPDTLDEVFGRFTYYGDNKKPGHELHDTKRGGNQLLRNWFDWLHSAEREKIPPILIFTKTGVGRNVMFRGLAVPGSPELGISEDLVAVWKVREGKRFQNYRSVFTILDIPVVSRVWLDEIQNEVQIFNNAPQAWLNWRDGGAYQSLEAQRTIEHRTRREQLPSDQNGIAVLREIVNFFDSHPEGRYAFEACALEIAKIHLGEIVSADLTRPWRDGGRDATGKFRIGQPASQILVDFALEAKCKFPKETNSSGVKDTSRLISRLRHRQFGVFVTTSCVHEQAYQEIVEDGHPVIVIAGADIVSSLRKAGISTIEQVQRWLNRSFHVK